MNRAPLPAPLRAQLVEMLARLLVVDRERRQAAEGNEHERAEHMYSAERAIDHYTRRPAMTITTARDLFPPGAPSPSCPHTQLAPETERSNGR